MNIRIVLSLFILVLCTLHGTGQDTLSTIASEDYDFDLDSYQKQPLEYSLLLDITSSLAIADIQSPLALLRYRSLDNEYFDRWLLRTEGSLRFSYKWFTGYCAGAGGLNYYRREDSLVFLRTNLEFHADFAYSSYSLKQVFTGNAIPVLSTNSAWEALAGLRILTPINTTFIVEYLYRSDGYTVSEMDAYHSALDNIVSRISSQFYTGQFVMRDYLYIRASQPDFFNIVYFSPSAYCLLNLDDLSYICNTVDHGIKTKRWMRSVNTLENGFAICSKGRQNNISQ